MLSFHVPSGQLNKLLLTNHKWQDVHTKLEGKFDLSDPLCFYTSILPANLAKMHLELFIMQVIGPRFICLIEPKLFNIASFVFVQSREME